MTYNEFYNYVCYFKGGKVNEKYNSNKNKKKS